MSRLLLSCVDKSLLPILYTTLLLCALPLPLSLLEPISSGPTVILIPILAVLQNCCASSTVLAMLLVRQDCFTACPSGSRSVFANVSDQVERSIMYSLHFLHTYWRRILTSCFRIIIILVFLISSAVFGSLFVLEKLKERKRSDQPSSQKQCAWPWCPSSPFSVSSLLIVPLPLLFLANRHRWSTVVAMIAMLSSFLASSTVIMFMKLEVDHFFYMIVICLGMDGPLRLCVSHSFSRKRKSSARVLNSLDTVLSQQIVSTAGVLVVCAYQYLHEHDKIWIALALTSFISCLYSTVFCPAAMMFCGEWSFCGAQPIEENHSESRSMAVDHYLGTSPRSMLHDRRYSAANSFGIYKKRSTCTMAADTRRASLPVLMHQRINRKSWSDLAKKCGSIDSCTSSPRVILKREPLLNSRGSLISAHSLSIAAHAIQEQDDTENL